MTATEHCTEFLNIFVEHNQAQFGLKELFTEIWKNCQHLLSCMILFSWNVSMNQLKQFTKPV